MDTTEGKKRLFIYIIFLSLLIIPLLIRLGSIMLFPSERLHTDPATQPAIERGPILDRNGKILAIQTKLKSVSAWIPYLDNTEETARILADVLGMSEKHILNLLTGTTRKYVFIKRKVTPTESEKIAEIKSQGKLRGINLDEEFARSYPQSRLACHIIGYVDIDNNGLDGVELAFDEELSPKMSDSGIDIVYGNQLFLTVDINIQFLVTQIAREVYAENDADAVMILVMNAKTGEILSSVSIPDFNPNDFTRYSDAERTNRPLFASYEPGSVFKIFTISSLLEAGAITTVEEFTCNGVYEGAGEPINCLGIHGRITAAGIIKYSCNVGAAFASEHIGERRFHDQLKRFGFGDKTGISLPGETTGIFHDVEDWSGRSKPAIAFGQEISVSAIQMAAAATALTNDGTILKPLIVKKIVSPEGKLIKEYNREPVRTAVSPATARTMLAMMEEATAGNGTARGARVEGVRIAAKTGTAEAYDPVSHSISTTHFIPSILGIFPADDPQCIVYIVIDHPKGEHYFGSRIAAPVLKKIIEQIIPVLNLPTDDNTIVRHSGNVELSVPPIIEIGSLMPDLTGTPKRLLLSLYSNSRITLHIRGEGYVVKQNPPPGTPVGPDTTIILELE
ncbi:MAG: PASTA domain-containing protein [Spirochaetales bacterium]|nr:PASTA domain-containing protein [Spirochaetales bacterium]